MLTVTLLVCAMMALTGVRGDEDSSTNGTIPDVHGANVTIELFAANCPVGWTMYNERCFLFVPKQMTWANAQKNCLKEKGTLASVHSFEEYTFIQQITERLSSWIGGSDCQEQPFWFWTDSTPMEYTSWCPTQPDNTPDQCCLQMNTGAGKCWDDQPCNNVNPSVCVRQPK